MLKIALRRESCKMRNYRVYRKFILLCLVLSLSVLSGCAPLCRSVKNEERFSPSFESEGRDVEVYGWLLELQLPNGLLESTKNSNFVSLYENALAAIVFSVEGDFERAELIFDFFTQRIECEMMVSPGGFGQFRDRDGFPPDGKPHRWLGDNAWLLIAINNYHRLAGNNKYEKLKCVLEEWIVSLKDEADGGIWGGYDQDGKRILKSTEGAIDAFNAVNGYSGFHKDILGFLKTQYWQSQTKSFLAWKEHEKYKYALDLHSWGYCAFKDMPLELLNNADQYRITKIAAVNNQNITGFCFDLDLDTIWLEGTGEMVVAYRTAGLNFMAEYYIRELEKMIISVSGNPKRGGIPYTTNKGTHYGEGNLWNGVETNPNVAASSWYLLGKWGYDPMEYGREKDIPRDDIFWIN